MSKPDALNVVMVEDSALDAELLASRLKKAGLALDIQRVETEEDLVQSLLLRTPDLIFSDFSLPNFSGLRALEIAVEYAPHTPFIYVSGTIGEERAIDALHRGATDYVLKSNLSRLPAVVERALQENALRMRQRQLEKERREQEERLQRLTRTYRMLSSMNSTFLRLNDRAELLDEVCRIAVEQAHYDFATICLLDPDSKTLNLRAFTERDRRRLNAGLDDTVLGRLTELKAPTAAVRTRRPVILNDIAGAAELCHLQELGLQAIASLPLLIDGTCVGALTVFSRQPHVFDDAETKILQELTANLAFALQYLQKHEAVQFLSYFDSLTGLAKRALFAQRIAERMATKPGVRLRMLVIDVQNLRAVNDSLGRHAGDWLIAEIAARLKQAYADTERLAHLGGGTFAIAFAIADNTAEPEGCPDLVSQVFSRPFSFEGESLRAAARCGAAVSPADGQTAELLIQNAEVALGAAREANDTYRRFGQMAATSRTKSFALEARLLGALERDEFRLHYQPKVSVVGGQLQGFEALLRWTDSREGPVSPAVFIPLLERSGAILEVGSWVMAQAARDMRAWFVAGLTPFRIAVNVSPMQLRQKDFVNIVLSNASLEQGAGGIDIEITESMLMTDLDLSIRKLSALHEAQVGVAIDDFGTGYSCLSLLGRLPIDTLKIDRSFVQAIGSSTKAATLVETIISLARTFEMRTVAEGVETVEQLKCLQAAQCDEAQGYLLSRPVPFAQVPALIQRLTGPSTLLDDALAEVTSSAMNHTSGGSRSRST
jgi:diguanylate cyclase (GGDEF)-like protein